MEQVGRLFVAVGLPDEIRAALARGLEEWTGGKPLPGRPVPPENWHVTLRFLGRTEVVAYERMVAALDEADLGERFRVTLAGMGAFPNPRRATVLWIAAAEGAERLGRLAMASEEAARSAGFEPEERPFRAHVTLSRIRPDQDLRSLLERPSPPPLRFDVAEVTVYRSHLGGGPARYEPIDRFLLET